MIKNNFILGLAVFAAGLLSAQKTTNAGGGGIKEAAQKIENTVPFVVQYLEKVSQEKGDQSILSNGKYLLAKEYNNVNKEYELFKGNLVSCMSDNRSAKKQKKCLNYNSNYFRNTLINYDNYLKNVTKENGFVGVGYNKDKDFNPSAIAAKIDEEYISMTGKSASVGYVNQLNSDDLKLRSFNELAK